MCLIVVAWKAHPKYPLIVAANRDEYYQRPSIAAHYWKESPEVLGGRDLEKGGTWLGVNQRGDFAAVTNFRGGELPPQGRSRGELVARYLLSKQSTTHFMGGVDRERSQYNPFNLLICDGNALVYTSDIHDSFQELPPGIHAIGNQRLESDERKTSIARVEMAKRLKKGPSEEQLFAMLADPKPTSDSSDPLENALSAFFIRAIERNYGTRASTLFLRDNLGNGLFCEQQFDAKGPLGEPKRFTLQAAAMPV
ncbi:NRDE family protein [Litorivivens sp.]|uniref:NRDE family protein n=1 Tax=Litorivivens sp. TaxID=2020868 RepID=UPI003569C795